MRETENTIIDFLVRFGIWENDYYSYKVIPTFTDGMCVIGRDDNDYTKFIPSHLEYDKLNERLDLVYVNVDDAREFYHVLFSSHTKEEQDTLKQMVHYIMETK